MIINKGIKKRPVKALIYGTEGIGKSTFASHFPKPIFVDLESGTHYLNVDRIDGIGDWEELLSTLAELSNSEYQTIVIDTADWAERLAIRYVCDKHQKGGIEEFGYGAGYVYLAEEFGKLIKTLDRVIAHNKNVVVLAHAILRTITLPEEQGSYDHWELKLNTKTTNKVAPLVKEWADMVLFANYKTLLVDDKSNMGAKKKAIGGQRVMYTTHTTFCDAKNRFGLEPMLSFDYKNIAHIVQGIPDMPQTLEEAEKEVKGSWGELADLMERDKVAEQEVQDAVTKRGYFPAGTPIADYPDDFVENVLVAAWPQIKTYIEEEIRVPFI